MLQGCGFFVDHCGGKMNVGSRMLVQLVSIIDSFSRLSGTRITKWLVLTTEYPCEGGWITLLFADTANTTDTACPICEISYATT